MQTIIDNADIYTDLMNVSCILSGFMGDTAADMLNRITAIRSYQLTGTPNCRIDPTVVRVFPSPIYAGSSVCISLDHRIFQKAPEICNSFIPGVQVKSPPADITPESPLHIMLLYSLNHLSQRKWPIEKAILLHAVGLLKTSVFDSMPVPVQRLTVKALINGLDYLCDKLAMRHEWHERPIPKDLPELNSYYTSLLMDLETHIRLANTDMVLLERKLEKVRPKGLILTNITNDLKPSAVQNLCMDYGDLESFNRYRDQHSGNYIYCATFTSHEIAKIALLEINGMEYGSNNDHIKVQWNMKKQ